MFDATGGIALIVRRRQQPAADFDPRGLRFGGSDQTRGDVAIDFGELILVDGRLAAVAFWRGRLRPSGQSTAKIAAAVISANKNHSAIKPVPCHRRILPKRRCAALHHRCQARQLTLVKLLMWQANPHKPAKM